MKGMTITVLMWSSLFDAGFDLAHFDAVTPHLDLMIDPAHELQVSIRHPAGNVAGTVEKRAHS